NGKKLKGEFALVKLKKDEPLDNSWLLIKHKDPYASDDDITKSDKSVVTERSMEEIADNKNANLWVSSKDVDLEGASKKELPDEISPMLATLIDKSFDDPDFIFEIKWD